MKCETTLGIRRYGNNSSEVNALLLFVLFFVPQKNSINFWVCTLNLLSKVQRKIFTVSSKILIGPTKAAMPQLHYSTYANKFINISVFACLSLWIEVHFKIQFVSPNPARKDHDRQIISPIPTIEQKLHRPAPRNQTQPRTAASRNSRVRSAKCLRLSATGARLRNAAALCSRARSSCSLGSRQEFMACGCAKVRKVHDTKSHYEKARASPRRRLIAPGIHRRI